MQISKSITNLSNFPSITTSGHPWLMVQPDPRTYQETEIHILFDKAEEMDTPQGNGPARRSRGRGDGAEGDHQAKMTGNDEKLRGTENKSYEGNEKGGRVTKPQVRQSCPPLSLSKWDSERRSDSMSITETMTNNFLSQVNTISRHWPERDNSIKSLVNCGWMWECEPFTE